MCFDLIKYVQYYYVKSFRVPAKNSINYSLNLNLGQTSFIANLETYQQGDQRRIEEIIEKIYFCFQHLLDFFRGSAKSQIRSLNLISLLFATSFNFHYFSIQFSI